MSFCTKSRISTHKWALSYDTPEIAHIARREVAYREIGALIDSIQLPPRDASISTPTSPPAEFYYSTPLYSLPYLYRLLCGSLIQILRRCSVALQHLVTI